MSGIVFSQTKATLAAQAVIIFVAVAVVGIKDLRRAAHAEGWSFANSGVRLDGDDPKRFANCERFENETKAMACRVGAAAMYMAGGAAGAALAKDKDADTSYYFAAFAALETANLAQTVLSTPRYGYRASWLGETRPLSPEQSVTNWAGICGHHADFFLKIMKELGIKARAVQFFYTVGPQRRNHIAAEAYYGGHWNYFDTTWNVAFPTSKPLQFKSHVEALADPNSIKQTNALNSFYTMQTMTGSTPLEYLTAKDVNVVADYAGDIALSLNDANGSGPGVEDFHDLPKYVGDIQANNALDGLKFNLKSATKTAVTVHTSASTGRDAKKGDMVRIGNQAFDPNTKTIGAIVDGDTELSVETKQDKCFVVLDRIEYRPL